MAPDRFKVVQISDLRRHLWDIARDSAQLVTELDIAIQMPLNLFLELLCLQLDLLEGLAICA